MRFLSFLLELLAENFVGKVEWELQQNFGFSHL